jgi:ethanolamine ammonia-lyase small subunit
MGESRDNLGAPAGSEEKDIARNDWPEIVRQVRARTPARLLLGRAGAAYRTDTQLDLRAAHAAARDAVRVELDLDKHYGAAFAAQFGLFEVTTMAASKQEYLLRPDLGRQFSAESRSRILRHCYGGPDLQVVLGDGLSVTAAALQGPAVFPLLEAGAKARNWSVGQLFAIRHCRVGILNEIGELLDPKVVVLLIGERPGLATAESLSAYMAYRPEKHHTDANRNLISNIHSRGLNPQQAAARILNFAARMMGTHTSGCQLPEEFSPPRALE